MTACVVPVIWKGATERRGCVVVRRGARNLAMLVALRWHDRTPTVAEVRRAFGLSRATAYRYLADLKQAKGEA